MKPILPVLHVEDEEDTILLQKELSKRQIYSHFAVTLENALEIIDNVDVKVIVSDGQFPHKKGGKVEPGFIPLMEELEKRGFSGEVVAWSNSTHVHEYLKNRGLVGYTKRGIPRSQWDDRGREFIDVKILSGSELAELIKDKLVEKSKVKSVGVLHEIYKEPATVLAIAMAADMRTGHFHKAIGENFGFFEP